MDIFNIAICCSTGKFGIPLDGDLHDVSAREHHRFHEEQRTFSARQCKVSSNSYPTYFSQTQQFVHNIRVGKLHHVRGQKLRTSRIKLCFMLSIYVKLESLPNNFKEEVFFFTHFLWLCLFLISIEKSFCWNDRRLRSTHHIVMQFSVDIHALFIIIIHLQIILIIFHTKLYR